MAIEKVFLADKQTLDATKLNTDNIKTELAAVKAYVDTLETQLGNNSQSASSNGSAHQKISELRSLIVTLDNIADAINVNVGSNANEASASGSVHAKIKELRTLVDTVEGTLTTINNNVNTIKNSPSSVIKSVQRGVVNFDKVTTRVVTISSVTPSKCQVNVYGNGRQSSTDSSNLGFVPSDLTETALTLTSGEGEYNMWGTAGWEVIEYV